MSRFAIAPVILLTLVFLALSPLQGLRSTQALSPASSPTFNAAGMKTSMNSVYRWALSRLLSNGTATLTGTSNNLLSTSLVGRVLTYLQLEIGNSTSLAVIQKMVNSEHLLLQDQRYITLGTWATPNIQTQLQIHRDVQKFLLRAYGLTLDQTARSDLVTVTQDIYLNAPLSHEYFDSLAWGLADAVWFAYYDGSPLPPSTDFSSSVQDLNLRYNKSAASADSANSFVDYTRLMHYLVPLEYTDGYYRLQGHSLDQTYLSLEAQLANQLLNRQMQSGNVSSLSPYKSYLVEDFARDMDSAYYLNNNPSYVSSAFRSESFLTGLYLQPNGNVTLPKSGEGFDPIVAFHLISIANDIRASSTTAWYSAASQASRIINFTLSIQNPDGTFSFDFNSTNPGFAYTTIASVAAIVDSQTALQSPSGGGTITTTTTTSTIVSSTTTTTGGTIVSTTTGGTTTTTGTIVSSTTTGGSYTPPGTQGSPFPGFSSLIPAWAYIAVPILLLILAAVIYEARHRTRYRGLVDK